MKKDCWFKNLKFGSPVSLAGKIILFFTATLILTFILPAFILNIAKGDSAMGLCFILFFAVFPVASAFIGASVAGDVKRLFWLPLAFALLFPLMFSLAIRDMVWDLYVYSTAYVLIGYVATVVAYIIKKRLGDRK